MRLFQYTILTFVVAFLIQYWVLSVITSKRPQNTVGKFYLSMVSASIMGILEVMIYDTYKSVVSLFYYLGLGLSVYFFIYMFKTQSGIDDADYLKQMLESHSKEMVLSQIAISKTENNHVRTIANNLINRRKRDIDVIEKMLDDAEKVKLAPITKTNMFNYMNIGRQDPPKEDIKIKQTL
jgi:branched-subunit amino acid transport protein AzlD